MSQKSHPQDVASGADFDFPAPGALPRHFVADRGELHVGLANCVFPESVPKSPRVKSRVEGAFHCIKRKNSGGTQ